MTYQTTVLADSPVAYYQLPEGTGTATDSSTNANGATFHGGTTQVAGPFGGDNATHFDGTGYAQPIHIAAYDVGDTFSFEAIIKLADLAGTNGIMSLGAGGGLMRVDANVLEGLRSFTTLILSETGTIGSAAWHHVVYTKTGATNKLYVDSVDVSGTATNDTCANPGFGVGIACDLDSGNAATTLFTGNIAHAALYNTALSAAKVLAHYQAGFGGGGSSPPPGLIPQFARIRYGG